MPVSRPAELAQLPFRLLVVGDFGAQAPVRFALNKTGFADAMASHAGRLLLEVEHPLARDKQVLDVPVTGLKDFDADRLVRSLPLGAGLAELRAVLAEVAAGRAAIADAERLRALLPDSPVLDRALVAVRSGARLAPPAADDPLDRLMGMVDVSGGSSPPGPAPDDPGLDGLLNSLRERIKAHPAYRARAEAWHSLKLLVDRLDERAGIRLEILSAPRDSWLDALKAQVLDPAEAALASEAPALVTVLFRAGNTQEDLDLLRHLGGLGEALQAPVLAGLARDFLTPDGPDALAGMASLGTLFDGPALQRYTVLRDKAEARWLCLAINDLALDDGPQPVRAPAAFAVAVLVAAAVARGGWPADFTGDQRGRLDDLTLPDRPDGGQPHPLDTALGPAQLEDLTGHGLAPLAARPGRDWVTLPYAPVLARPAVFGMRQETRTARAMATLGYQLVAARLARGVGDCLSLWRDGAQDTAFAAYLQDGLWALVADTGAGAAVRLDTGDDNPGRLDLTVTLGRDVLDGASFGFSFANPG